MVPTTIEPISTKRVQPISTPGSALAQVKLDAPKHPLILKTFRLLIADLCQQFNGGHPGGAIGMAAIGVALFKYILRHAPHTPTFFNRDRFILSNGHCCLFQYAFLHLTGYQAMTLDQLKSYHSPRPDALCPGHPEIEHEGIEVTTGPLGQGIANAVGMAVAQKNLAARFNREGFLVVDNQIFCMTGDACLQEGVALEAISLAGHWKLGNLTVIYDNNQITCDGSVDLTNTEDVNAKMRACGWNVVDILDGNFDVYGIVATLEASRNADRPTFINCRTIIGLGSAVSGKAEAHGAAFGKEDVRAMKVANGFNPDDDFVIGLETREFFSNLPARGEKIKAEWQDLLAQYATAYPNLSTKLHSHIRGELSETWQSYIPNSFPQTPTATRASSGLILNPLAAAIPSLIVGTADLTPSVHMAWPTATSFQYPTHKPTVGPPGNYSGRYIHYGIREHAMAAIANGLAAYNPGTFIPVTSSFFMFYLYAAPAVRMGALMKLQVIHAATHDSIGLGEDGPTHQPIELATLYRAMPNFLYIRPADSEETAGAWTTALAHKTGPTLISTSRHKLPQLFPLTDRAKVLLGAYVIFEEPAAHVTLIGVGAELHLAIATASALRTLGVCVRVVSFPCWRLFDQQERGYRWETLRRHEGVPAVVIEPYAATGWERYADAGICMKGFGHSLPGMAVYEYFGFDVANLVRRVRKYLDGLETGEYVKGEFADL